MAKLPAKPARQPAQPTQPVQPGPTVPAMPPGYAPSGGNWGMNYPSTPPHRYGANPYAPSFAPPPTGNTNLGSVGGGGFGTTVDGISSVNVNVSPADYQSVQGYADAAHDQAMRYLNPMMDQQNRRFEQMLINKGIDPNSAAGQQALAQLQRGQNDLMSTSAFGALEFGQGIQDQMFQQGLAESDLASRYLAADAANRLGYAGINADLRKAGAQLDLGWGNLGLGYAGLENSMAQHLNNLGLGYANLNSGMDKFYANLGLMSDQQAFDQMMKLEGLNYRDYITDIGNSRYQDSLALSLLGLSPPGYGGGSAPSYPWSAGAGNPLAGMYGWDQVIGMIPDLINAWPKG